MASKLQAKLEELLKLLNEQEELWLKEWELESLILEKVREIQDEASR